MAESRNGRSERDSIDHNERRTVASIDIRTNTKRGYETANTGDSINLSYPNSETRRGRVGRGVAQTILTEQEQGVIVDED